MSGGKDHAAEVESTDEQEFGGAAGATLIMVFSHVLMVLMAASLYGTDWKTFAPTVKSTLWLVGYHVSQLVLAALMPGVEVPGQSGLGYRCNAYSSFYTTLGFAIVLHLTGIFDLTCLVREYPSFLSTAMLLGNLYAVLIHVCYASRSQLLSTFAFFMGIGLHPRLGPVDIKMLAETRISWTLLLLFTLGAWFDAAARVGWLNPVLFMVLAHGLYANACAKGEHFIPYTWDITTEKFGWMLCWWNFAGVPLLYCYQSLFLAKYAWDGLHLPLPAAPYYMLLTGSLCWAYYVWDTANYHKCYFKMEMRGEILERNLFPTFSPVKEPKYLKCDAGVLLIDGWYAHARKIHYAADMCMALLWGLCCGIALLPYFYALFFSVMIIHRTMRDEARCREKYGPTWEKYLKIVPWRFVPGLY